MYNFDDKTSIGGAKEFFETTCWTDIELVSRKNNPPQEVISNLIKRYWKPVYCYIRRKGCDNELAKDLTQAFFQEIVLETNLCKQADQFKGRFRRYLLTALDHYMSNWFRKEARKKRAPAGDLLSLDNKNLADRLVSQDEAGPEQVFHYTWASNLLDTVLKKVKSYCYANDKITHWEIFSERVLSPLIDESKIMSIKEIKEKYNIESEQKISNMLVTVKRIFKSVLEQQLRPCVQSDSEIDDEIKELIKAISINSGDTNIPVYFNKDKFKD